MEKRNIPRLIPLSKWNEVHMDPPVKTLRKYVFENTCGFVDAVVVRRGSRILLREAEYFEWLAKFTKNQTL